MAYKDFDLQSQLDDNMGSGYQNDNYGDPTQANIDYLANQYYPNTANSTTGFGGLSNSALANILKLGTGVYGAYATNQQGQAQQQIANQLLQNADPYLQYRQQAEIPFKLAQMQQYGNIQDKQNQLMNVIAQQPTIAGDPALQAYRTQAMGYNPTAGDYGFYQDQLQKTYTDPLGVYNSQGYQKLADLFGSQIARRDAASGRLSQYGDRANEMQGNFLNYLDKYRSGLNSAAGTAGSVQGNYLNSMLSGATGMQNANTGQLGALSGLFGQVNSGLNNLANTISADRTAGAGAAQAAQLQNTGSALNNAALSSLINPETISYLKSLGG